MDESSFLTQKMRQNQSVCLVQIVFADIAAYSKRRGYAQVAAILALTECFRRAIESTASSYSAQLAPLRAHLQHDIVVLPTGDGIAVAFPFDNLPGLSMDFVDNLMAAVDGHNKDQGDCAEFQAKGYCDCHTLLQLRTGVSEGPIVLFEDFNEHLNIAGNPVSQAAQVRNLAEPAQVFMTDNAYQALIDNVRGREQQFRTYLQEEVQDGVRVNVHQYVNETIPGLNLTARARLDSTSAEAQPDNAKVLVVSDPLCSDAEPEGEANREPSLAEPADEMQMVLVDDLGLDIGGDDPERAERFFSRPFLIASRLVTQDDYEEVIGRNPSHFIGGSCPVELVSWFDAVVFCNELSVRHGFEPVYKISGQGVSINPDCNGYRLPTETEWEHCCRGELDGADRYGAIDQIAWYSANAGGRTHPVGEMMPNRGIYDLLGNVWEWCGDWYQREHPPGPQLDYGGPLTGFERVLRGGSWSDLPKSITAVDRHRAVPSERDNTIGFRVARTQTNDDSSARRR